jgi:hypothetical protein
VNNDNKKVCVLSTDTFFFLFEYFPFVGGVSVIWDHSTEGQLFGQPFPLYCHRRLQPMSLVVLSDCNDFSVFAFFFMLFTLLKNHGEV